MVCAVKISLNFKLCNWFVVEPSISSAKGAKQVQLYYTRTAQYLDQIQAAYTMKCSLCRTGGCARPSALHTMQFRWMWNAFTPPKKRSFELSRCALPRKNRCKYGLWKWYMSWIIFRNHQQIHIARQELKCTTTSLNILPTLVCI